MKFNFSSVKFQLWRCWKRKGRVKDGFGQQAFMVLVERIRHGEINVRRLIGVKIEEK